MRVLDLFCGAGAVSRGLVAAGAEVVGVDLEPQPRYPYAFLQHDALTLDMRFLRSFDAIWASPPCLRDTVMRHAPGAKGLEHPELIPPTRRLLQASGLPYVIENVEGAELINPIILCGSMFGLGATTRHGVRFHLERHRKFETNWPLKAPRRCDHQKPVIGVYGAHVRCRADSFGGRGSRDFVGEDKKALAMQAMGIDFPQTMGEISQAVPPAFSHWIGLELARHLEAA